MKIRPAPETLETEDILEMVNAGIVRVTIADDYIAAFWKQIFTRITLRPDLAVRTGATIAWMVRKDSAQLRAELNAGLARYPESSWQRAEHLARYLKNTRWAKAATSSAEIPKFERTVALFKKYGDRYDIDYLVLMAQGIRNPNSTRTPGAPPARSGSCR